MELPCDASDADKFVRVWMKVGLKQFDRSGEHGDLKHDKDN